MAVTNCCGDPAHVIPSLVDPFGVDAMCEQAGGGTGAPASGYCREFKYTYGVPYLVGVKDVRRSCQGADEHVGLDREAPSAGSDPVLRGERHRNGRRVGVVERCDNCLAAFPRWEFTCGAGNTHGWLARHCDRLYPPAGRTSLGILLLKVCQLSKLTLLAEMRVRSTQPGEST